MNFKQLLDLTYNMIDEVDEDEQIEIIVKGAINEAYRQAYIYCLCTGNNGCDNATR